MSKLRIVAIALLVTLLGAVFVKVIAWYLQSGAAAPEHLRALLPAGALGPVVFVLVYVVGCLLAIPGFFLTPAAGFLFGLPLGIFCVSLGALIGACIAFLIARYLAREQVSRRIAASRYLQRLDSLVAEEGWKIVLLARLCPVIPFRLSNYAFGLADIPFTRYALATWLGTLPSASVYVYLGFIAGSLATLGAGCSPTALEWVVYLVGAVALLLILRLLRRLSLRALEE